MAETSMEITTTLAIPALIVVLYVWINKLENTPYLLVVYFAVFPVLISAIVTAVQLYKEKFGKKNTAEKRGEEQEIQRLMREKGEILQLVERLSQEAKQQGSEEKRLAFEREAIKLARERLELAKQYSDLEKSRTNNVLEAMRQVAETFPANADQKMREIALNSLIAQPLPQSEIGNLERVLQKQPEEA